MTYYDTQQQYLNNPQFNPQQWAPFNSQTGGYGLGPAAITARRHAGRPRLRSARLWPARLWSARLWSARLGPIIRTGQSCAELRSAIWAWRAANAVGVRCPG